MRKSTYVLAAAAGIAAIGAAAAPAVAENSGVTSGPSSLLNVDASSASHWQVCGQNLLTQSFNQDCDNRDHIGKGPQSGVTPGATSVGNLDLSSASHWQICGQNSHVAPSLDQMCKNTDHMPNSVQ